MAQWPPPRYASVWSDAVRHDFKFAFREVCVKVLSSSVRRITYVCQYERCQASF